MRKIANNPFSFQLKDLPASKLPCHPGESVPRATERGGLVVCPITAEEQQSMFYGKEN